MKFGKKSPITSKKNLIVNLYIIKYLKTKIKSYKGKVNTNFHNNEIPKKGSQSTFLLVIFIDSCFRTGRNYYPQVFLQECKYLVKEIKMHGNITDNMETSSEDSDQ